jgi:heptaprenyl diphosphate synthase
MIKIDLPEKISYVDAIDQVKDLIDETLSSVPAIIDDVMQHLRGTHGKRFRAVLLLSCAVDEEGFVCKDAVIAAAIIEILHLATLVHDDVIDDAKTRRGKQSIQNKFGKKTAVVCGDYLFCTCFELASQISANHPERFSDLSRAISKICLGELSQLKHNGDFELSVKSYLKIIAGKTSAMFAFAMYTGSLLHDDNIKKARTFAKLGYYIGMMFQLEDDCIDYESDYDIAHKPVKHDLAEGVVTLPLIFSLAQKPLLKHILKRLNLSAAEYKEIISEVIDLGGIKKTRKIADRYYLKAKATVIKMEQINKRKILIDLLERIYTRKF